MPSIVGINCHLREKPLIGEIQRGINQRRVLSPFDRELDGEREEVARFVVDVEVGLATRAVGYRRLLVLHGEEVLGEESALRVEFLEGCPGDGPGYVGGDGEEEFVLPLDTAQAVGHGGETHHGEGPVVGAVC